MIQLPKRAKVTRTDYAVFRRYKTRCGRYAVVFVKSLLGLSPRWLAIRIDDCGEYVISRHRKKAKAAEACEKHSNREEAQR